MADRVIALSWWRDSEIFFFSLVCNSSPMESCTESIGDDFYLVNGGLPVAVLPLTQLASLHLLTCLRGGWPVRQLRLGLEVLDFCKLLIT